VLNLFCKQEADFFKCFILIVLLASKWPLFECILELYKNYLEEEHLHT
jgi:hypothetical protein